MRKSDVTISFDESGFKVINGKSKKVQINWSDIDSISVFKRDLITFDEICMELLTKSEKRIELNEEMTGWEELVKAMPEHLEGCVSIKDWFPEVTKESFETNKVFLFSRKTISH